jgi:cytochrome c oxidase subunit 3
MSSENAPQIDVSGLPAVAFDSRAPVWWGNTLMIVIESMTVLLLVTSYFYLFNGSADWPPSNAGNTPPLIRPLPKLSPGNLNLVILLSSLVPMIVVDLAARKSRAVTTSFGLFLLTLWGVAAIAVRFQEFAGIQFRWDDNAYASLVWSMLGLHLSYIVLATLEAAILVLWIAVYGLDDKHAVDVTLTAGYWYWMVGVDVLLYTVVYWTPRWI